MPFLSISLILQLCPAEEIPEQLAAHGYSHQIVLQRGCSTVAMFMDAVDESDIELGYWTIYTTKDEMRYCFKRQQDAMWARLVLDG